MVPLHETVATLTNVEALTRCGFCADASVAAELSLDSPTVHMEDARSQRYMALVVAVLRHRSSISAC